MIMNLQTILKNLHGGGWSVMFYKEEVIFFDANTSHGERKDSFIMDEIYLSAPIQMHFPVFHGWRRCVFWIPKRERGLYFLSNCWRV